MTKQQKYKPEVKYAQKPITQTWMESQGQIDEDQEENEDYQKMGANTPKKENFDSLEVETIRVANDQIVEKDTKEDFDKNYDLHSFGGFTHNNLTI